jgi:pyruvate dehydrogenase (quinone)
MSKDVADFILDRLRQWGVSQVFGYPGDGINGLVGAFGRADKTRGSSRPATRRWPRSPRRYAKFPAEVGVCMATSGPGAIHLLNGLYDAKLDHVPVVAIVGQTARSAMGGSYQQEVDLQRCSATSPATTGRGQRRRTAAHGAGPRHPYRAHPA